MKLDYRFLVAALLVALAGCGLQPEEKNDLEKPAIRGYLKNADGKTAAAGALVKIVKRDVTAPVTGIAKTTVSSDITQSDADGYFTFAQCVPGIYSVEGTDASGNGVRLDSVVVVADNTTDLKVKSLKTPGVIRGKVSLENAGDPSNVFVLAFGSDRFVQVGSDGTFIMANLPYGAYQLKIVCVLPDCGASAFVPVTVLPGDTVELDSVVLAVEPLVIPQKVKLTYDAKRLLVQLSWEACEGAEVKGYHVYKYDTAETDKYPSTPDYRVEGAEVTGIVDSALVNNTRYVYGVAVVAQSGSEGRKSDPVAVTTLPVGNKRDTVRVDEKDGWIAYMDWTEENKLMVVSYERTNGSADKMFLYVFSDSLTLEKRVESNKRGGFSQIINVESEDRVCWADPLDSVIHCGSFNQEIHYSVNFHQTVENVKVYNETYMALVGMNPTNRFHIICDKNGAILYKGTATYNSQVFGGRDGKWYCTDEIQEYPDKFGLYEIDLVNQRKNLLHNLPSEYRLGEFLQQVNGFVLNGYRNITVFDHNMQLTSRFHQVFPYSVDNSYELQRLTVNSKGKVAGITADNLTIVTFDLY